MTLRPRTTSLTAPIRAVIPTADGLAVLTAAGIELVGTDVAPRGTIAGESRGTTLVELADGRFAAFDPAFGVTSVFVGRRGGELQSVLGADYAHSVHATTAGFIAPARDKLWLDCGEAGRWVASSHTGHGSWGLGDRVVTTSFDSVAVYSERGDVLASRPIERMAKPIVVGERVVLCDGDELAVLALADLTPLPGLGRATHVTPFGAEILTLHDDGRIACSGLEPDWPRWDEAIAEPMEPKIVGDRIVVGSWTRPAAWILDRDGQILAEVQLADLLRSAIALGDGIALSVMRHPDVQWWRPNAELVALEHDVADPAIFAIPHGVAAAVEHHLFIWSAEIQGPAFAPVATAIPVGSPVVVDGRIVTPVAAKRFFVVGHDPAGNHVAIPPDAAWRAALTRADALAIMQRSTAGEHPDVEPRELGFALGISKRVAVAALRERRFPLVPPHELAGYDYLGTFTTTGSVTIADPCYAKKRPLGKGLTTAIRTTIAAGTWHAYARNGEGSDADRTAELVAIHGDGFTTFANELLGGIGVDSGCAGVFDKASPAVDLDHLPEEGIQHGRGVLVYSGHGDGMYEAFAGKVGGAIVKLRLAFLDGAATDRCVVTPKAGRAYSPKQRYAQGEAIAHPTFGTGTVTAVRGDGKIEVAFGDGPRVLVHARG